jgi:hypothetical protein
MEIIKLNTPFEKFSKPWAKIESIPLPDGTHFVSKECIEAPEHEGANLDIEPIKVAETRLEYLPDEGGDCLLSTTPQDGN